MASGSGTNQDDNQTKEPVRVLHEESSTGATAAAAAEVPPPAPPSERLQERAHGQLEAGGPNPSAATAAAAAEPLAPAPPSERLQERAHGQPEAGGRNPSAAADAEPPAPAPPSERLQERAHGQPEAGGRNLSAAAAAAEAAAVAQRKGKRIVAPSGRSTRGGKPFLPPRAASASRAREPPPPPLPRRPRAPKGKKPSAAEVVERGMKVRNMFHNKLLISRKIEEKDEPEKDQVKSPTICPEDAYKLSHWTKVLERTGNSDQNCRRLDPQVNYQMSTRRLNRRWCYLIAILVLVANIPNVTGFQRFNTIKDAVDELRAQPLIRDMAFQLLNEDAQARRVLWWTAAGIGITLFILAQFIGPLRHEEPGAALPPPAADRPLAGAYADVEPRIVDMAVGAIFVIVIVALSLRFAFRRG